MRITEIQLAVAPRLRSQVTSFYRDDLGFEETSSGFHIGESRLRFSDTETSQEPFYHFAFLLPGDRFTSARDWLRDTCEMLLDPDNGSDTFYFENWDAHALYVHDPAGNIVEFIAHRGVEESGIRGPFAPDEVVGLSELGLVCRDRRATAKALVLLGAKFWEGSLDEPGRLAFVGERARTLILVDPYRPWLPTGRPAEIHPTTVELDGVASGRTRLPQDPHIIVGRTRT